MIKARKKRLRTKFRITRTDSTSYVNAIKGRDRWAIKSMPQFGKTGFTPSDRTAPRRNDVELTVKWEHVLEIGPIVEKMKGSVSGYPTLDVAHSKIVSSVLDLAGGF